MIYTTSYGIAKITVMVSRDCRVVHDITPKSCSYRQIELAILYVYIPGTDLNFERAAKLREKAVSSSSYLPPATSDGARFHGQRAGMVRI